MKETGRCPKCESQKLMIDVRVLDKRGVTEMDYDLELLVVEDSSAIFFRGEKRFTIRACVCGGCGYTELYTDDAAKAYSIYNSKD